MYIYIIWVTYYNQILNFDDFDKTKTKGFRYNFVIYIKKYF
jgi:hypothetical protein